MKTTIITLLLILSALLMVGCEDNKSTILIVDVVPLPPQGVTSVTGDEEVYVYWNGTHEEDIAGYAVYRSFEPSDNYVEIGVVTEKFEDFNNLERFRYIDDDVTNGETYFYAVSAIDEAGQESVLSFEDVYDTPRPEGVVTLFNVFVNPDESALILDTTLWITSFDDPDADIYIDTFLNVYNINAANDGVDLQDMGYTASFDEIGYAPTEGWSESGWAEIILGHTYVIWDDDLFFAKMRVTAITLTSVTFQWAFQLDPDNPELVQPQYEAEKPVHSATYLKKRITSNNQ